MPVGSLTLELQALGRPEVALALDQAGQDVLICRPGAANVQVRAILYQLESRRAAGPSPGAPEYQNPVWQAVFDHLAPVREAGYTVVSQNGQVFVPEGAADDPAEQGVALIVRLLPLVERTRLFSLAFQTEPTLGTEPGTGNPVELPGVPLIILARLEASTDPRLRDTTGADQAEVVLIGRWGSFEEPLARPVGVRWGQTSPLVIDGQPGTLTVSLAWPDPDLASEQQFGARFLATWRTP